MLTKEDIRLTFRIIALSCRFGILPLNVNTHSWELKFPDSKWKRVLSMAYYAVHALHTAYVVLRLPYLLLRGIRLSLVSLLVHFTMLAGMTSVSFWHLTAFFRWPSITVTCFNKAFESGQSDCAGNASRWHSYSETK